MRKTSCKVTHILLKHRKKTFLSDLIYEIFAEKTKFTINHKKKPEVNSSGSKKKAASYSPALHCSTIGAGGLNFSVRNGKRWDPAAITT